MSSIRLIPGATRKGLGFLVGGFQQGDTLRLKSILRLHDRRTSWSERQLFMLGELRERLPEPTMIWLTEHAGKFTLAYSAQLKSIKNAVEANGGREIEIIFADKATAMLFKLAWLTEGEAVF